jgi:hypothetical protein
VEVTAVVVTAAVTAFGSAGCGCCADIAVPFSVGSVDVAAVLFSGGGVSGFLAGRPRLRDSPLVTAFDSSPITTGCGGGVDLVGVRERVRDRELSSIILFASGSAPRRINAILQWALLLSGGERFSKKIKRANLL